MTATIDWRHQTTMSSDEISRSRFVSSSASLSVGEVRFTLTDWTPSSEHFQRRQRLRSSLSEPVAHLVHLLPNWDGHHAKVPSVEALRWAVRLLAALPDQVPDPHIMPSTEGGVLIEWNAEGVELILSLSGRGLDSAVVSIDGREQEGPAMALLHDIEYALALLANQS